MTERHGSRKGEIQMMQETKELVNSIRLGLCSPVILSFMAQCVDFVEKQVGKTDDTAAVRLALEQNAKVDVLRRQNPGKVYIVATDEAGKDDCFEIPPSRPVEKFV